MRVNHAKVVKVAQSDDDEIQLGGACCLAKRGLAQHRGAGVMIGGMGAMVGSVWLLWLELGRCGGAGRGD